MALYFSNANLKKLNAEQLHTLGLLADAVAAETINEPEAADNEAMTAYCKQLKEKSEAKAQAQQALISSFV